MKNLTKRGGLLFLLSAISLAPLASYAYVETGLTAGVTGTATIGTVLNETDLDATVGAGVTTDATTTISGTNVDIDAAAEADSDAEVYVGNDDDTMLRVNADGVAIVSAAQVQSDADLEVFSSNITVKEQQVANVDIDSDDDGETSVKVVYRHKGKLFGFIPVTVKSITTAEVNEESQTEINSRMSWWSFLVANKNHIKADIEEKIRNNATVQANLKANASAQAKAAVAEAIIAEVKAHAEAEGSATVQG